MKATKFLSLLSIFILIGFLTTGYAQSNPATHEAKPEVAKEAVQQSEFSNEDFVNAVTKYIAEEIKNGDGFFVLNNPENEEPVQCSLVKIHKDNVKNVGNNEHFVCVDFKTDDGKEYDVDIFMKGNSKDNFQLSRTLIHKENGVEKYTWTEEDGVWKMGEATPNKVQKENIEEQMEK